MPRVIMYCTAVCPYCVRAEMLLNHKGVEVEKVRVDQDPERFSEMLGRSGGRRTVPQVFIDGIHVGGYDDLAGLERAGELDAMLAPA